MMNSCSTKGKLDECIQLMRDQHMKHIATKDIPPAFGLSYGIMLFGEDKMSQKNIKRHNYARERGSKK